jgi:Ca2+-binding EF-hand superfamily protein
MTKYIWISTVLLLISASTFAQGRHGSASMFEQADANKDGVVSKEEFLNARAAQFTRFDRNADGYIDDADVPERMRARRDANGGGDGKMRKEFDTNGDGKVSKDEFVGGPTAVFDRMDSDRNGSLDPQELEAVKAALRERAAERRQR